MNSGKDGYAIKTVEIYTIDGTPNNDYIVLRGIVFKKESDSEYTNKYEPIAQYKLDTTLITIPALEPETPCY